MLTLPLSAPLSPGFMGSVPDAMNQRAANAAATQRIARNVSLYPLYAGLFNGFFWMPVFLDRHSSCHPRRCAQSSDTDAVLLRRCGTAAPRKRSGERRRAKCLSTIASAHRTLLGTG
jgi:hypothetical protein